MATTSDIFVLGSFQISKLGTLTVHRQKFCFTDAAQRPFSRDLVRVSKLTTQPPFTLRIKRGWKYYSPPCLECMEDKPCSYYVGSLWKFKGGSISHQDKLELPSSMFHNWWWVNHSWERGRKELKTYSKGCQWTLLQGRVWFPLGWELLSHSLAETYHSLFMLQLAH